LNEAFVSLLLTAGFSLFIIYSIYRRRNWARIVLLLELLLTIFATVMALWADTSSLRTVTQHTTGWLWLGVNIAEVVATVLLFTPSARAWFAADDENGLAEQSSIHPPAPSPFPSMGQTGTYASIAVFVLAMTQTAFYQDVPQNPDASAVGLLSIGWMGLLEGYVEWIANPLMLYSWFCAFRQRYWPAVTNAAVALVLMLVFLSRSEVVWVGDNGTLHAAIHAYGLGYWLWLASAAIMVIAGGLAQWAQQVGIQKRSAV
jgi:hypothetical protein